MSPPPRIKTNPGARFFVKYILNQGHRNALLLFRLIDDTSLYHISFQRFHFVSSCYRLLIFSLCKD